jgi:hypothetical protein
LTQNATVSAVVRLHQRDQMRRVERMADHEAARRAQVARQVGHHQAGGGGRDHHVRRQGVLQGGE